MVRGRRQAQCLRSGQRQDAALARRRRACRHGLRRQAPVPDRRGSHPQDRSARRAVCSPPIPAPGGGGDSGLAWAEGTLWVGQYRDRKIHQVDPDTGAILRTIESNRFVTGVTWVDGELWHATWEGERAICATSIRKRARCSRASRCRRASACPGSSPTAATGFSAAAARAARCGRSAGRSGTPPPAGLVPAHRR